AIEYTLQIAQGLKVLHKKGLSHRDIKLENVFLQKSNYGYNYIVKLGDFGLLKNSEDLQSKVGTIFYMAPEMLDLNKQEYNEKVDIWALGCALHEMLIGEKLFQGNDINQIRLFQQKTQHFVSNKLYRRLQK
ncbi:protein kinase domain protein, partial [Ichthyophthirius multifiliis]